MVAYHRAPRQTAFDIVASAVRCAPKAHRVAALTEGACPLRSVERLRAQRAYRIIGVLHLYSIITECNWFVHNVAQTLACLTLAITGLTPR